MQSRRKMLVQMATVGMLAGAPWSRLAAQDRYDQAALLQFDPLGQFTLLHYSDLRGMLRPHHMRPAALSYGPGLTPELTGEALRIRYGIGGRTPMDAAMTSEGFDALATVYGPMGGLAHLATLIRAIHKVRPGALVLDGGGSGSDVVAQVLQPDAATFDRAADVPPAAALAFNVPGQPPDTVFSRQDRQIAVIGIADPHRAEGALDPKALRDHVVGLRAQGVGAVVILSRLGFAADRALAQMVPDIDVILSGRSGHALPNPERVGDTYIVASGVQGRFLSRVDIAVEDGRMRGLRHALIPVFADLIVPDAEAVKTLAGNVPEVIGKAENTLHHRDAFSGTWEALIAEAMRLQTGAEVALVPALFAAPTIRTGQPITARDIADVAAQMRVAKHRLSGAAVKILLEAAAEAVFAADPFARHSTRMMRAGGLQFTVTPSARAGGRISELALLSPAVPLEPAREVETALLDEGTGMPLDEVLTRYIKRRGRVSVQPAPVTVRD